VASQNAMFKLQRSAFENSLIQVKFLIILWNETVVKIVLIV